MKKQQARIKKIIAETYARLKGIEVKDAIAPRLGFFGPVFEEGEYYVTTPKVGSLKAAREMYTQIGEWTTEQLIKQAKQELVISTAPTETKQKRVF